MIADHTRRMATKPNNTKTRENEKSFTSNLTMEENETAHENTRSSAIAEKATRTAVSGIAMQHAGDDYSRRGNFGSSLVHSMF